jgi:hypothetical protein
MVQVKDHLICMVLYVPWVHVTCYNLAPRPTVTYTIRVLTVDENVDIQATIVLKVSGYQEIHALSRLDIRKIEDCQQTTFCANDNSLSKACTDGSILATFVREPAHPSPFSTVIAAKYPPFVSFIQLEGAATFRLVYWSVFEREIKPVQRCFRCNDREHQPLSSSESARKDCILRRL